MKCQTAHFRPIKLSSTLHSGQNMMFVFWKVKNLINSSRSMAVWLERKIHLIENSLQQKQRWIQCVGQHRQLISVFITHASIALTYLNGQDSLSGLHPNIKCLQVSNKIWQQCFRCCFYSSSQIKKHIFHTGPAIIKASGSFNRQLIIAFFYRCSVSLSLSRSEQRQGLIFWPMPINI